MKQKMIDFLLENANPSIKLRVKKEILKNLDKQEEMQLQEQILGGAVVCITIYRNLGKRSNLLLTISVRMESARLKCMMASSEDGRRISAHNWRRIGGQRFANNVMLLSEHC